MKVAKKQAWKEFHQKLNLTRPVIKRLWQTIHRLIGKKAGGIGRVKSKDDTLLLMKRIPFVFGKSTFQNYLIQFRVPKVKEVLLRPDSSSFIVEIVAAIKSLKSDKVAGMEEI